MCYVYEADAKSLMDPLVHRHQYRLSLNNASVCSREVFLLFVVNSAPEHREERQLIRETWGSVKEYSGAQIRVVFLIGECTKPKTMSTGELNERLNVESDEHSDLIKGNFIDNFANLTYKTVMGLYWVNMYCLRAWFVMKTDDDVTINLFKVVHFLQEISQTQSKLSKFYYGRCVQAFPDRSRSSKRYISFSDYKHRLYPPFCMGEGYILSKEAASQIYRATTKVPFFWMDDVFIGFCAELANIEPIDNYFGYYIVLPYWSRNAPWEYTILKVNKAGITERRERWSYLESLRNPHSLQYYRSVGTGLIMLLCLLVCILVMFIKFLYNLLRLEHMKRPTSLAFQ